MTKKIKGLTKVAKNLFVTDNNEIISFTTHVADFVGDSHIAMRGKYSQTTTRQLQRYADSLHLGLVKSDKKVQ